MKPIIDKLSNFEGIDIGYIKNIVYSIIPSDLEEYYINIYNKLERCIDLRDDIFNSNNDIESISSLKYDNTLYFNNINNELINLKNKIDLLLDKSNKSTDNTERILLNRQLNELYFDYSKLLSVLENLKINRSSIDNNFNIEETIFISSQHEFNILLNEIVTDIKNNNCSKRVNNIVLNDKYKSRLKGVLPSNMYNIVVILIINRILTLRYLDNFLSDLLNHPSIIFKEIDDNIKYDNVYLNIYNEDLLCSYEQLKNMDTIFSLDYYSIIMSVSKIITNCIINNDISEEDINSVYNLSSYIPSLEYNFINNYVNKYYSNKVSVK